MFNWFNFFLYALITSITPGPNNIICMTNGKHVGIKRSISFSLGVCIGVFILLLLSAIVGTTISALLPKIKLPMTVLGAVYILFLAYKTFTSKSEIVENHKTTNLGLGIALQFINPKAYIYSIVSMEMYILPYFKDNPLSLIFFSLLLVAITFFSTLCWTFFGKLFETLFSKYARITNTIMALLLVYCAISLFL